MPDPTSPPAPDRAALDAGSPDARVLRSWHVNAAPWAVAVRERRITSRRLVTDRAVLDALLARRPRTVLDLGCGEGWLAWALAAHGVHVTGVDAVAALVEQAGRTSVPVPAGPSPDFRVASYEAIADGALDPLAVDVIVANFSLIGGAPVDAVVRHVPRLLAPGGALVIQTLHPLVATGERPYVDGWREGSWDGFGPEFSEPAPWYFRTTARWVALLAEAGLRLQALDEPLHPETGRPASLLLVATTTG